MMAKMAKIVTMDDCAICGEEINDCALGVSLQDKGKEGVLNAYRAKSDFFFIYAIIITTNKTIITYKGKRKNCYNIE